jgi:hypothetical protein
MPNFPAQLTFELPPNSSILDNQIVVAIVGKDPAGNTKFGYLDFASKDNQAYVLSYDDVYGGQDPSIHQFISTATQISPSAFLSFRDCKGIETD